MAAKATFFFVADADCDPIVFEKEGAMKKLGRRVIAVLREPELRPVEVWAIRIAVAYVTAQLGIDAAHIAGH